MFFRIKSSLKADRDDLTPKFFTDKFKSSLFLLFLKRIAFVSFILLTGLLAEDKDLKWMPYIESNKGQVDSASLAPDGKSFYTLQDGVVNQWQFNPIKKLKSFTTDIKSTGDKYGGTSIFISTDSSRLILWTRNEIHLWDLKSDKLLNKLETKTSGAIIQGDTFLTINQNAVIVKRDLKTLSLLSTTQVKVSPRFSFKFDIEKQVKYILGNDQYLYFGGHGYFIQIDAKTFNKIKEIEIMSGTAIPNNQKYLFFFLHTEGCCDGKYRLSLKTGIIEHLLPDDNATDAELYKYTMAGNRINKIWPSNWLSERGTPSINENMLFTFSANKFYGSKVLSHGIGWMLFNSKDNYSFANFLIFKDREWLFINSKGFFELSKNARKYVKMQLVTGKFIPKYKKNIKRINDDVFKQYKKVIQMKDEK